MYGICVEPVWSFCTSRILGFLTTTCEARLYRKFYGVVVAVPRGARTIAGISGRWSRLLLPHPETAMSTSTCPWNHGSNLHRPKCHWCLLLGAWVLWKSPLVDVSLKSIKRPKRLSCQQRFLYVSSHAYANASGFQLVFHGEVRKFPCCVCALAIGGVGLGTWCLQPKAPAERVGNWWRMPEFENQPPNLFFVFL